MADPTIMPHAVQAQAGSAHEAGPAHRHDIRALDPLDGHYASGPGVSLSPIGPRAHVSLRAHPAAISALNDALKLALPDRPKLAVEAGKVAALWLGPEDWLLVGPKGGGPDLVAAVEGSSTPDHSAVDVSHRYVGIAVEGLAAEAVLSAGCPQDLRLRSFAVGAVSRSLFGKADVVIWRRAETEFEVLCVRSFADYVWGLLVEAARAPAL